MSGNPPPNKKDDCTSENSAKKQNYVFHFRFHLTLHKTQVQIFALLQVFKFNTYMNV